MAKSSSNLLRIYRERAAEASRLELDNVSSLSALVAAFRELTGWSLEYRRGPKPTHPTESTWSAPVNPGVGVAPGYVTLDPVRSASPVSQPAGPPPTVGRLASAVAGLLGELLRTRHVLWQREAELAAGVPVVFRRDGQKHLAARLQAVLRGGAEAVGCHAAALYLLDEATTTLKLRSSWGLPRDRLTEPPRPLRGALADLEAMLGHVVVLEDTGLFQQWNPPESFPAAACAPIATPSTILGTLWVFCHSRRDFNDRETNIIEVVAGRLAADLEREVLMREGVLASLLKRQLVAAERLQQSQLPSQPPLFEGWDVSGWVSSSDRLGGGFFDWFTPPKGTLALALGQAGGKGIEAALSANAVRAALRAHAQYHDDPATLLGEVNSTLWTSSAGDQSAAVFLGLAQRGVDGLTYASAGDVAIVELRSEGLRSPSKPTATLGSGPETLYCPCDCRLKPGEAIVVVSGAGSTTPDGKSTGLPEALIGDHLSGPSACSARELVALVRQRLEAGGASGREGPGRAILIAKRTDP